MVDFLAVTDGYYIKSIGYKLKKRDTLASHSSKCHKFLYSEELSGANYLSGSHPRRSTQTVVISSRYSAGSIQGFYHHRYSLKGYTI